MDVTCDPEANAGMIEFVSGVDGVQRRSLPFGSAEDGLIGLLDLGPDGQIFGLELLNFDRQTAAMDLREVPDGEGAVTTGLGARA